MVLRRAEAGPHGVERHVGCAHRLPLGRLLLPKLGVAVRQVYPGFHSDISAVAPNLDREHHQSLHGGLGIVPRLHLREPTVG